MQELDFFMMAQGCGLDVKGEKKHHKSYLQFFLKIVNSVETFTRVPLLKELLSQQWNRSREHESKVFFTQNVFALW